MTLNILKNFNNNRCNINNSLFSFDNINGIQKLDGNLNQDSKIIH